MMGASTASRSIAPLNRRFQPCIFCYDFPKTAKVVGKHTKKAREKGRNSYSIGYILYRIYMRYNIITTLEKSILLFYIAAYIIGAKDN